jgi:hypothetical protein
LGYSKHQNLFNKSYVYAALYFPPQKHHSVYQSSLINFLNVFTITHKKFAWQIPRIWNLQRAIEVGRKENRDLSDRSGQWAETGFETEGRCSWSREMSCVSIRERLNFLRHREWHMLAVDAFDGNTASRRGIRLVWRRGDILRCTHESYPPGQGHIVSSRWMSNYEFPVSLDFGRARWGVFQALRGLYKDTPVFIKSYPLFERTLLVYE